MTDGEKVEGKLDLLNDKLIQNGNLYFKFIIKIIL